MYKWQVFSSISVRWPRGKDTLLKKQGQENWPTTQKNICEGHPLGHRTEIRNAKVRHTMVCDKDKMQETVTGILGLK